MTSIVKTYRFAMFGRTSSGKTCVLAALSMPRMRHYKGLTCNPLPIDIPSPIGDRSTWKKNDRAASLHCGKEWLDKAIEKLKNNDVPPPNPNTEVQMIYEFNLLILIMDHLTLN